MMIQICLLPLGITTKILHFLPSLGMVDFLSCIILAIMTELGDFILWILLLDYVDAC